MRIRPSPAPLFPRGDWSGLRAQLAELKRTPGVEVERLGEIDGSPVEVLRLRATGGKPPIKIAVFASVHGDEPAGAPAALALLRAVLTDPRLRDRLELTVVP